MRLVNKDIVDEQLKDYSQYLNIVVSGLLMGFSLACLSLDNTQKAAFFALPVVLGLLLSIDKIFPEEIRILRLLIKEEKDKSVRKELKKELSQCFGFLGMKFIFSNLPFLWAYISYFFLFFPEYVEFLKAV